MKVLVTGARGLVGSYSARSLYHSNHEVIALHRQSSPGEDVYPWKIEEADLLTDKSMFILESINPDVVVHCAAILPRRFHGDDTTEIAKINRRMDSRIVKYCRAQGCCLIYISGTSIYGSKGFPWNEESPVCPWGPYTAAKHGAEQEITDMLNRYIILRISAPYAPEQSSRTVLKIFIERALQNADLLIYGSGQRQQDFTAAEDVATAVTASVRSVANGSEIGVFNIASGQPVSMFELAELVIKCVSDTKSKIITSSKLDPQEEYRAVFDISKARDILGWTPSILLQDGIRRWVNYLEKKQ